MEPLPVPAGLEGRISELWERARKRWLITMAVVLPLGSIAGIVGARMADGSRRTRSTHHHPSAAVWIVLIALLVVEAVLIFVVVRYVRRRFKGQWVPLSAGLPWRERRELTRRIRRGEPSADQFHRYVETFTARKIAIQRKQLRWLLPLGPVAILAGLATNWSRSGLLRWYFIGCLVLVLVGIPAMIRTWRGADRYLRTVNIDPDLLRRSG